jgi:hypothetical protein
MQGRELTPQQKQKFLAKLRSNVGNVSKASKAINISRNTAYDHKKSDADFSQAWDNVIDDVIDEMEQELHRRSTKGVLEPVFYKGEMVAKIRKYSDRLLEFALKGKKPEVYRERVDINNHHSGALDVSIQATIDQIYDDGNPEPDFVPAIDAESQSEPGNAGNDPAGESERSS